MRKRLNNKGDFKMILSNVVSQKKLNEVRLETLKVLKDTLINSFGPMGSNTLIKLKGSESMPAPNRYTKDGFSIMKSIGFTGPIEDSVKEDILECSRYVALKVGDGTTSTVVLTSTIFEKILNKEIENGKTLMDLYAPRDIVNAIKSVVSKLTEKIKSKYKEPSVEDIYNVALISTNGNEKLATEIKNIYAEYGMGVYIDLNVSSSVDSYVKSFEGMTLDAGYSDPSYINTTQQVSSIRDPKIYAFRDPIDTPEMMSFLDAIIDRNIMQPIRIMQEMMSKPQLVKDGNTAQPIPFVPTVIMAPRISADMSNYLTTVVEMMRSVPAVDRRPPLNIITNIYNDDQFEDIVRMTGCKQITKYIDPNIQKDDIAKGIAPTVETIDNFAGSAELVESDVSRTKVINPKNMIDENGEYTEAYRIHLEYLQDSLVEAQNTGADYNVTGGLKRRINSLKCNMVQYYIGGITSADRDAHKDLLEDAILNCRSTAQEGVGYGANIEGLMAANTLKAELMEQENTDILELTMCRIFLQAYIDVVKTLYSSGVKDDDKVSSLVVESLKKGPYNLVTKAFDNTVLTSLNTDVMILDTVDKILSIMVTANQAIVPAPIYNTYTESDEEK